MENINAMSYYDRIIRYEEDKRRLRSEHPEYTANEYDKALKMLIEKWRV